MASSESSNLVAEFEQAYAEALSTLCEEEILSDRAAVEEQKIVSFCLSVKWWPRFLAQFELQGSE